MRKEVVRSLDDREYRDFVTKLEEADTIEKLQSLIGNILGRLYFGVEFIREEDE